MLNIQPFLQETFPHFLTDLQTLVNIDCGTYTKEGVDFVGDWINQRGQEWGWDMEYYPVRDAGNCHLARLRGQGAGKFLMLGHMDTVYPVGIAAERPLRTEGSKLIGPGVGDMKGGLLVAMYAMRGIQLAGYDNFAELAIFFGCDEEIGSPTGKKYYMPLVQKSDAVLVLEGARANGNIVSARKGSGEYKLRVKGKSAHAGVEPEKGANAILELAHQIIALHNLNGIAPGVTVNAGIVGGGTRTNVVPDDCFVEVDTRAVTPKGAQIIHDAILNLANQTHVNGTTIQVEGRFGYPPMAKTPAIARMAEWAVQLGSQMDLVFTDQSTGGASDANNVAAAGIPVLDGLGPSGGLDHSPDEYIDRDSIIPRTQLLAALLETMCDRRDELVALRS